MTAPTQDKPKPGFSFDSLAVEPATVPSIRRESSGTAAENPFTEIMRESYSLPGDEGRQITVPAEQVPKAIYLLRAAAANIDRGCRIVLMDRNGNPLSLGSEGGTVNAEGRTVGGKAVVVKENGQKFNGNVRVVFKAKDKRQRQLTERNTQAGR